MAGVTGWPNQLWNVYLLFIVGAVAAYFAGTYIAAFLTQVSDGSWQLAKTAALRAGLPLAIVLIAALWWAEDADISAAGDMLWLMLFAVVILVTAVFSLIMFSILGRIVGARGAQLALFCILATVLSGSMALASAFYSMASYNRNVYQAARAANTARQEDEASRFLKDYGLPFPRATLFIAQNFRGTVPFAEHGDMSMADSFAERSWNQAYNHFTLYFTDLPIDDVRDQVIKGLKASGYQVSEDKSRDPTGTSFYICGDRPGSFVIYKCVPDPLGDMNTLYSGPRQLSMSISIYETYADLAKRKAGALTPLN